MAKKDGENDAPKLTNDINFAFSMRRMNGRKLTRKEVVQLLVSFISAWEENSEEFLEQIYDENEPVQFAAGEGDKIVMFGTMVSDAGMLREIMQMRNSIQQASNEAKATDNGGFGDTDKHELQNIPDDIADTLKRLIEENDLKHNGE